MARSKRKWTEAEREMVLEMVAKGRPQSFMAKAVGTSIATLRRHFKQELSGKKRQPGLTSKDWTRQEKTAVLAMASYGIPYADIAGAFGVTRKTLIEHFGDELEHAMTKLNANIARSLVRSALVGNNVAAQIFLAKTRLRWSERVEIAHEGSVDLGSDALLETQIADLTPDGREALRTLVSEAPKASREDETPANGTLH